MSTNNPRDQRLLEASPVVVKARALAAAGHHAAVVEFLGSHDQSELQNTPTLALLYGIAQARLGRHEQGLQWIDLALAGARQRSERGVERHALNARGAIALSRGDLNVAADICAVVTLKRLPRGKSPPPRSTAPACSRASPSASTTWPTPTASRLPTTRRWRPPTRPSPPLKRRTTKRCLRQPCGAAPKSAPRAASRSWRAATSTGSASFAASCPTPSPRPRICACWPWCSWPRTICSVPRSRCARSLAAPSCTSGPCSRPRRRAT